MDDPRLLSAKDLADLRSRHQEVVYTVTGGEWDELVGEGQGACEYCNSAPDSDTEWPCDAKRLLDHVEALTNQLAHERDYRVRIASLNPLEVWDGYMRCHFCGAGHEGDPGLIGGPGVHHHVDCLWEEATNPDGLCPRCYGTGGVSPNVCSTCHGAGVLT